VKRENSVPTFTQKGRGTLSRVRFSDGVVAGPARLSPRLTPIQQRALEFWILRLPVAFAIRLPRLKLAVAEQLSAARKGVFINEHPHLEEKGLWEHVHAASFIPERYIVLEAGLFRRRVELGRILYHELCHFVWTKLGNPTRRRFAALIGQEFAENVRGELGYSSEYRKASLFRGGKASGGSGRTARVKGRATPSPALWREYICESFCDTGSFVLLGRERREHHSEYTLSDTGRRRRLKMWSEIVLKNAGTAR
jgi:hypothetical protein